MDLSEAKARTSPRRKRKRIGRGEGSGHGKTAGRGMDGARSRSGWSQRNMTGGNIPLWRRLPKIGFTNAAFRKEYSAVNIDRLAVFDSGQHVTPDLLRERGILKGPRKDGVKVLGRGELDRPLSVSAHRFSKSAKAKIEAAGGSCEILPGPAKPVRNKMRQKTVEPELPGEAEEE